MKLAYLIILMLAVPLAYAHQPRLAVQGDGTEASPYLISNPAVSQVFYGELRGSPVYYKFTSPGSFSLFLQILAPYAGGYDANGHKISVYVSTESRREVAFVYEDNYIWSTMFEEFGSDYYFVGPTIQRNLTNDTYVIRLFNRENSGRYALVVGTEEAFPPQEIMNALVTVPLIKQNLFGHMILENFLQLIGIITIAACAATLATAGIIARKSKEHNRILIEFYQKVRYPMWAGFLVTAASWYYIYSQNTASIFGGLKTLVFIVMLLHWVLYFFTSDGTIRKVQNKRAFFTPKFLNHIVRGMLFQMVMIVLLLLLTAITI